MNQHYSNDRVLALLSMEGQGMKKIIVAMNTLLSGYMQETGMVVGTSEAQALLLCKDDMQHATETMLSCINMMLEMLGEQDSEAELARMMEQYFNGFDLTGEVAVADDVSELDIHDGRRSIWLM